MGAFCGTEARLEAPDVLLVDDSDVSAECVEEFLALLGYTVARARSAAEGWLLFEQACPRAVVTDSNMPGEPCPEQSGLRLARKVKAASPRTPVIMLAGIPPAEALATCDRVFTKPTSLRQLAEALAGMGVTPR